MAMNNLMLAMVHEMARRTKTELLPRHYEILEYTQRYYDKNGVGPLPPNIRRHTGATGEELKDLFPNGLHSVSIRNAMGRSDSALDSGRTGPT